MDPAVAFDGVNYLVTWVYLYGDIHGYYTDIQGARVTPERTVLDPEIYITGAPGNQYSPSVVFGGSTYFVVWEVPGIRGARVTGEGSVLDPEGSSCPRLWSECRGRLRRHELPGRLGQPGRRLRDAREPSGRCARAEPNPDHDKWSSARHLPAATAATTSAAATASAATTASAALRRGRRGPRTQARRRRTRRPVSSREPRARSATSTCASSGSPTRLRRTSTSSSSGRPGRT